jgi:hypothetical protein
MNPQRYPKYKWSKYLEYLSTSENLIWRHEELHKLINHKNIINYIKAQRLSSCGHVQRILDTRTVRKIFNWKTLE